MPAGPGAPRQGCVPASTSIGYLERGRIVALMWSEVADVAGVVDRLDIGRAGRVLLIGDNLREAAEGGRRIGMLSHRVARANREGLKLEGGTTVRYLSGRDDRALRGRTADLVILYTRNPEAVLPQVRPVTLNITPVMLLLPPIPATHPAGTQRPKPE